MTARQSLDKTLIENALSWSKRATCPRASVGCVLVNKYGEVLSTGYNGPPRGADHCTDNYCPGVDCPPGQSGNLCEAVHAEINALIKCTDIWSIESVYCTHEPCVKCAGALANTSCQNVFYINDYAKSGKRLWINRGKWSKIDLSDSK